MHWTLKVTEYGKIRSAEIEAAPLTLFVGDNNSGKSYLMSLLWGIQNFGTIGMLINDAKEKTEAARMVMDWTKAHIAEAWKQKKSTAKAGEIAGELQTVLREKLKQTKDYMVSRIFNSEDVKIKDLDIELKDLDEISLSFEALKYKTGQKTDVIVFQSSIGVESVLTFSEKDLEKCDDIQDWLLVCTILSLVTGIPIHYESGRNDSIYLPAARTGFMLTKDIINKVGRNMAFNIGAEQERVSPFTKPVNRFLDVMSDLAFDGRGQEGLGRIAEFLESRMAEGTIEMSTLPNKEVSYVPAGQKTGMPLRIVSAVVTELAPLILILKHKNLLETLFYEEPEMCLHPQLQQKIARVICQLANAKVNMMVTTHSDIILQHMNNMLSLGEREDRDEICEKLGYTLNDLLSREQIKVYQLKTKSNGSTEVEELVCGRNGFAIPTFNDALDKIMDEAYTIQE